MSDHSPARSPMSKRSSVTALFLLPLGFAVWAACSSDSSTSRTNAGGSAAGPRRVDHRRGRCRHYDRRASARHRNRRGRGRSRCGRADWEAATLTPCKSDGTTCTGGLDCCGGFCVDGNCSRTPPGCSRSKTSARPAPIAARPCRRSFASAVGVRRRPSSNSDSPQIERHADNRLGSHRRCRHEMVRPARTT